MSPLPDVTTGSDEPLYNIGVVARMTGVSMATLRAWERRYEFPESERTAGGHRLYSEKDVLRLRWVKERIDEGMQTSQAIQALRHQERVGNLRLVDQPPTVEIEPTEETGAHVHSYSDQLYRALVSHDLSKADLLFGEILAISSPEDIILGLIAPVLSAIGDAWEQGKISIATEHMATNYLRQRLMMWMLSGPPPRMVRPILLTCAPNEWHEGSLLVLGSLLRRRRWPISYLGQAVPLEKLEEFIRDLKPSMVVIVAMTEQSAIELVKWPELMPGISESGKPMISYGGRIFSLNPEWRTRMAGFYLGDTFQEGIANIERLLPQGV